MMWERNGQIHWLVPSTFTHSTLIGEALSS